MTIEITKNYDKGSTGERRTVSCILMIIGKMLLGFINDNKEDGKLIFTSRVLRTKLGKKNHPMLIKNFGGRNVLKKDPSIVQSKKIKGQETADFCL